MSDIDDLEDGESPEEASSAKRRSGLGGLLPTILKYAAIGIGAVIFIVTVVLVTIEIKEGRGKSQTQITDPSSPYRGKRPTYLIFEGVGSITTNTLDTTNKHTVTVTVNIGYDKDELATTGAELNARKFELRDFLRYYFNNKYAEDLKDEERIKREILEQINTRYLDSGRAKIILFDRLDVTETTF